MCGVCVKPCQVVAGMYSRRVVAFLPKERMNERINARAQDGKVDDQMWREYRGSQNSSTKMQLGARSCATLWFAAKKATGVCTVSFRCAIRLRGKLPRQESRARTLHDTRQFARHASICQCQRRWPQTWHLRLPFTGLAGWNWLARCIRFRRSMNHAIEIGKGYFFFFRGFVVVAVTHCYRSPEIALIDRNRVVSSN